MMEGKRLAQVAHGELIERLAENQELLLKIEQLKTRFGDRALPPNKIFRSHNNALTTAADSMTTLEKLTRERIAEYTETILEIEKALKTDDDAWTKAFARQMAENIKAEREAEPNPKWRDYTYDGNVVVFQNADDAQNHIDRQQIQDARLRRHDKTSWKIQVLR